MSIEGMFGIPGSGKSYYMVKKMVGYLRWNKDKDLYCNMDIDQARLRELTGWRGKYYQIDSLEDFVIAQNGLVILDEINLWAPSRMWAKIPQAVIWKWAQVRKSGLDIYFTSQSPKRVDSVVRELVFYSYYMSSFVGLKFFFYECWLGIRSEKKSIGIVPFSKKVASVYDTKGFITVPDELGGQLIKDAKERRAKKDMEEVKQLDTGFAGLFQGDETTQGARCQGVLKPAAGSQSARHYLDFDDEISQDKLIMVGNYLVEEKDLIVMIEKARNEARGLRPAAARPAIYSGGRAAAAGIFKRILKPVVLGLVMFLVIRTGYILINGY